MISTIIFGTLCYISGIIILIPEQVPGMYVYIISLYILLLIAVILLYIRTVIYSKVWGKCRYKTLFRIAIIVAFIILISPYIVFGLSSYVCQNIIPRAVYRIVKPIGYNEVIYIINASFVEPSTIIALKIPFLPYVKVVARYSTLPEYVKYKIDGGIFTAIAGNGDICSIELRK